MIRFTVKENELYAIIIGNWPGEEVSIVSLADGKMPEGKITSVRMLGSDGELTFTVSDEAMKIKLPSKSPCKYAYTLKIAGLKMNAPTTTASGNPQ